MRQVFVRGVVAIMALGLGVGHAAGGERPAWFPPEEAIAPAVAAYEKGRTDARAYYQRELIGAWEQYSSHNASWDEPMREFLAAFIEREIKGASMLTDAMVARASNRCMMARCDDPLFWNLFMRFTSERTYARHPPLAGPMLQYSERLMNSPYRGSVLYHALVLRARYTAKPDGASQANEQDLQTAERLLEQAMSELPGIAKREGLPMCELEALLSTAVDASKAIYGEEWKWTLQVYSELERLLPARKNDLQTIKGIKYISYAWTARGDGFANTVTSKGWKLFEERLKIAEDLLTAAWEENHDNVRAAGNMLRVELGQGKGREVMEKWFARAIAVSPYNPAIYEAKRYYLEPKWHGSDEEMLAFAREAVEVLPPDQPARLVLLEAYRSIAQRGPRAGKTPPEMTADYVEAHPEVWPELRSVADGLQAAGKLPGREQMELALVAVHVADRESGKRYFSAVQEQEALQALGPVTFQWLKNELLEQ